MIFKSITSTQASEIVILPFLKNEVNFELISEYTGVKGKPDFEGSFKHIMSLYHATKDTKVYLVGL
uniref:hypothetical protein n=1 Tax=Roseivirga sp. TaxID=1964215 RepID=UPI00404736D9